MYLTDLKYEFKHNKLGRTFTCDVLILNELDATLNSFKEFHDVYNKIVEEGKISSVNFRKAIDIVLKELYAMNVEQIHTCKFPPEKYTMTILVEWLKNNNHDIKKFLS
jgi:hypothetical protein